MKRLKRRSINVWSRSFLVYYYLWDNIAFCVDQARKHLSDKSEVSVLDVGCGNKPYLDLFREMRYVGMDFSSEGTEADVIGSGMAIPFDAGAFDLVFSTQVIEHVNRPERMFEECFRVLKGGGVLVMSAPFYWPLHEEPFDFHRFTKYGLQFRLEAVGFVDIKIFADGGSWAQIFQSIALKTPNWLFPLRIFVNVFGLIFDKAFYDERSPLNYTIIAKKI